MQLRSASSVIVIRKAIVESPIAGLPAIVRLTGPMHQLSPRAVIGEHERRLAVRISSCAPRFRERLYPPSPPEISRTIEPTNERASPKSMRVWSR